MCSELPQDEENLMYDVADHWWSDSAGPVEFGAHMLVSNIHRLKVHKSLRKMNKPRFLRLLSLILRRLLLFMVLLHLRPLLLLKTIHVRSLMTILFLLNFWILSKASGSYAQDSDESLYYSEIGYCRGRDSVACYVLRFQCDVLLSDGVIYELCPCSINLPHQLFYDTWIR